MMPMTQTTTRNKRACWEDCREERLPLLWLPKPPHSPPQGNHYHGLLVFLGSVLQAIMTDEPEFTGEIKQIGHAACWGNWGKMATRQKEAFWLMVVGFMS